MTRAERKAAGMAIIAAVGFSFAACGSGTEPPPCDPTSYAALAATCGDDAAECDRQIDERKAFCARQIKGEK